MLDSSGVMLVMRINSSSFHIFLIVSSAFPMIVVTGKCFFLFSGRSHMNSASMKTGMAVILSMGSNPMCVYATPDIPVATSTPKFLANQHIEDMSFCLEYSTIMESHPTSAMHMKNEHVVSTETSDFFPIMMDGEYANIIPHMKAAMDMYDLLYPKSGLSDISAYTGLNIHGTDTIDHAKAFSAGSKW